MTESSSRPYPESWDNVADVRVFRAATDEWDRLAVWNADMKKRGWKLLRVTTETGELVAIYGRTRQRG